MRAAGSAETTRIRVDPGEPRSVTARRTYAIRCVGEDAVAWFRQSGAPVEAGNKGGDVGTPAVVSGAFDAAPSPGVSRQCKRTRSRDTASGEGEPGIIVMYLRGREWLGEVRCRGLRAPPRDSTP
jgi:hypothetical protein